jgi:serine/threonine protein kinase
MALQPGEMIGQYRVEAQTGTGGMATVYKAYHPRLDRHVAIKMMHQTLTADEAFHARFEREARIVAKLEHPNIVPIFDFSEHERDPYLVMKYIEGRTLKNILKDGALPLHEVRRIMTAVAAALDYAHKQGVLHRDVKPSNIILDANGTPYLTDFGLARIAQAGEATMSADMMLGTGEG